MSSNPNFKFQTRECWDGEWSPWGDANPADLSDMEGHLVLDLCHHMTQVRIVFLPEDPS